MLILQFTLYLLQVNQSFYNVNLNIKSLKLLNNLNNLPNTHNSHYSKMTQFEIDDISSASSVDTFAPVAVYRLKYYEPDGLFDQVLYMLIRPPRFVYNQKILIPGRRYQQRYDYQVHNIPFPLSIYWAEEPKYIILYLHGNSSSRFQGYLHLKQLPQGACLACFDFDGCGLRKQGKFITLGKKQSIQVDKAVQYLQKFGFPIIGWGRSMGAVSLLMSSKCKIMLADSPFSSLYDLCKETSLNFLPSCFCCVVHCLFPCLFCCVRNGVQKKSGVDPNQLQIIKAVQKQPSDKCLLIMAGKQDSMIHYSHAQKLYQAFKGKNKRIILFEGTHNSNRPQQVLQECFDFIDASLQNINTKKSQVSNPCQFQTSKKVLRIQRTTSKSQQIQIIQMLSMQNGASVQNLKGKKQFQMSNESLLPKNKLIELKTIKISQQKSSNKKIDNIEIGTSIRNSSNFACQNSNELQEQNFEAMIKQGIGKFQQDLNKQKYNNENRISFKMISKQNEIESSPQKKTLKPIKSINQINQIKDESIIQDNQKVKNNSILILRQDKLSKEEINKISQPNFIRLNSSERLLIKTQTQKQKKQSKSFNQKEQKNNIELISNNQCQKEQYKKTLTLNISTNNSKNSKLSSKTNSVQSLLRGGLSSPLSHLSSVQQDSIKVLDKEQFFQKSIEQNPSVVTYRTPSSKNMQINGKNPFESQKISNIQIFKSKTNQEPSTLNQQSETAISYKQINFQKNIPKITFNKKIPQNLLQKNQPTQNIDSKEANNRDQQEQERQINSEQMDRQMSPLSKELISKNNEFQSTIQENERIQQISKKTKQLAKDEESLITFQLKNTDEKEKRSIKGEATKNTKLISVQDIT